jgi:Tol biopolymer transport system component
MPLAAGARLGPYEVLSPLGAGGMGEVYRARDTRLDRTVALKVLPVDAAGASHLERLRREARAVARLSHPHICTLHDVGEDGGRVFLVMECVDGETLARRLDRGPLPLDQALRCAIEIAEALDAAHRQGVVHRDLKPGNVMLTRDGVKLLDFGLARLEEPEEGGPSDPPTEGLQLTAEGTVPGTLPYMSPEQLEGRKADSRTDIFALGCVIYEMVAGKRPFSANSRASLIGAILHEDPPSLSTIQPLAPPALDRVVAACLAKEPDDRWQSARDLARELRWIAHGDAGGGAAAALAGPRPRREALAWGLAAVATLAAVGTFLHGRRTPLRRPARASILPAENAVVGVMAISPDGRRIVVAGRPERPDPLWVRAIGSQASQSLGGTEGASFPFWSPDGRSIGFFAGGKLKRVDASGGSVQTMCDAPAGRGGAWSPDGVIVFAPGIWTGLHRVSASGGSPMPVTRLDPAAGDQTHRWPSFLPDGRRFLYFMRTVGGSAGVFAASLDSPETRPILEGGSNAVYADPGYLLFFKDGSVLAQAFDARRLRLSGDPVTVADHVASIRPFDFSVFSVSQDGALVFLESAIRPSQVAWFDRQGRRLGPVTENGYFDYLSLSPDGKTLAVFRLDPRSEDGDLWTYDTAGRSSSRFTFRPGLRWRPVWSPDGRRIAFGLGGNGVMDLYAKASSNLAPEEPLLRSPSFKTPTDWSPDGRWLAYQELPVKDPAKGWDLWALPVSGEGKPFPIVQSPFTDVDAHFSPDGRWLAYVSDESGALEVYVRPFPGPGAPRRVSMAGGHAPKWRRDGKELFYVSPDRKLTAVDVHAGASFETGTARALLDVPPTRSPITLSPYEVSADGQRILLNIPLGNPAPPSVTLLLDWPATLTR